MRAQHVTSVESVHLSHRGSDMGGARNRRAGHNWERSCANYMTDNTRYEVVTTRSLSGGTTKGVDLASRLGQDDEWSMHLGGWSVECKNEQSLRQKAWLKQAADQAVTEKYVVLAKNPYHSIGEGWAIFPLRFLNGVDWPDEHYVMLQIDTFVKMIQ